MLSFLNDQHHFQYQFQFKYIKQNVQRNYEYPSNENFVGKNWTADESSAFERDELIDAATGTRVQKTPVTGKRVWHMFIITAFKRHKTPGYRLHSFTALLTAVHVRVKDFEQFGVRSACSCHAYARHHIDARFHSVSFPPTFDLFIVQGTLRRGAECISLFRSPCCA